MRQAILHLSTFLILLYALPGVSQVTITQSDLLRPASFIDSSLVITDPGTPFPEEGANILWDYSTIGEGVLETTVYTDATDDPDFTDALNYFSSNITLAIGGFTFDVPSNLYEAIDADGWYRTGRSYEGLTIPLTPVSGGANDRIDYLSGKSDYVGRMNIIEFPMTYQDQWEASYYYDLNYEVTVVGFGLNQTPAFTRTTITEEREVVGYGSIILPRSDGEPSGEIEVLLVKGTLTQMDSFFLGGSLAPQAILDAFGLEQGLTRGRNFYNFYAPGISSSVLLSESPLGGGATNRIAYSPQVADMATSTRTLSVPVAKSFPNPAATTSSIKIVLEQFTSSGQVRFTDLQGRVLQTVDYTSNGSNSLEVEVPASLSNGMFVYQVFDEDNILIGVGKLQVF